MKTLIDKLYKENNLNELELINLLSNLNVENEEYLFAKANATRNKIYGNRVFLRGIIEFSSYCKNTCYYCGLRGENKNAIRRRMSIEEIMSCCMEGYNLGIKTFVLQSGEDSYYDDNKIVKIIKTIKDTYSDVAITLSIGEKDASSYLKYKNAGADRYLLRHEIIDKVKYDYLHPNMSYINRHNCLINLKAQKYQVGAGFIVGLLNQDNTMIAKELLFLKSFNPHMIGIGPFIPMKNTPLENHEHGSTITTYRCLAILRLLLPSVLLPATTSLAVLDSNGFYKGLNAGANVIMPTLTSKSFRKAYTIYEGRECVKDTAKKDIIDIKNSILRANCILDFSRGDHIEFISKEK